MYKQIPAYEPDHDGYEYVDPDDRCKDCGHKYKECTCGDVVDDDHLDAPWEDR